MVEQVDKYYGVRGWLKFFVIICLYVTPIFFWINCIFSIIGFFYTYSIVVLFGIIQLVVGWFIMSKWVKLAKQLRDMKINVISSVKKWLKLTLAWNLLGIVPLNIFMSYYIGYNSPEKDGSLSVGILNKTVVNVVLAIIGFIIWYSYFNVSRRIKATYSSERKCASCG